MKRPLHIFLLCVLTIATVICISVISCKPQKSSCPTGLFGDHCQYRLCYYTCGHGGVCDSSIGKCICPTGYEGNACETISRDKFIGSWSVFEKGSISTATQYPATIERGSTITDVVMKNFYNYFSISIKGYVAGDTVYIPSQQSEGHIVYGIGVIQSNTTHGQFGTIEMRYAVVDTATGVINDFGFNNTGWNPSLWNR